MILNRHSFGVWSFMAKKVFKAVFKKADSSTFETIQRTLKEKELAVYIHIPFCRSICLYCPYVRYVVHDPKVISKYVDALEAEIRLYGNLLRDLDLSIVDIHAGGGTPSLLSGEQFERILSTLAECFETKSEIAIEANPEDLTDESRVFDLVDHGVTEVSLGVQSFNPQMLRRLGRRHSVEDSIRSIENLRQAGVNRINIDMMYMIPGQSIDDWERDLEIAVEQDVDEITCYPTLITEYCPGYRLVKKRKISQPNKRTFKKMVYATEDLLSSRGFEPVEIYGYSRKHGWKYVTVNYEMEGPLLGIGCGAMGFTGGCEYVNTCSVSEYIRSTFNEKIPVAGARLVSSKERAIRYTVCRLFVCRDLKFEDFRLKFKEDFRNVIGRSSFSGFLTLLRLLRYIQGYPKGIRLTRKGLFTAHLVCWAFVSNVPCRICEEYMKTAWPTEVTIP